ncbi:hypothetical protein [Paenibacillus sp. FSL M7-0896]|uniref:hypothetical protein n=1 Tax=Paenibacillus sp. FSL M7-0896 TaxID=2921610 RepID=UPI0030D9E517
MGISAYVLFETGSNILLTDLLKYTEDFCAELNLFYGITYKKENSNKQLKHVRANISDRPFVESTSRQLCIDFYDEPYEFQSISFDWLGKDSEFFEAIVVDDFCDNEDLLFNILFEFQKKYPDSKIWMEDDWFYSLNDLQKIANKYDGNWCYKNPKDL